MAADEPHAPLQLRLRPGALRTLQQAGRTGMHAWLLTGDDEAALEEVAYWLAARLICPNGGDDGCDVCARVARGVHPDLHHERPEGVALAIEPMRDLIEQLVRRPFEADVQVAVISAADTLDSSNFVAGNSLLKVIEEPPGPVVFILLARRPAQLLPTIRSRVTAVALPALSPSVLIEGLAAHGIDEAAANAAGWTLANLSRVARGELERAVQLVQGGAAAVSRQAALPVAEALSRGAIEPADAAEHLVARLEQIGQAEEQAATAEFEAMIERMPEKEGKRFRKSTESDGMEKRIKRRVQRVKAVELRLLLDELAWWYRDLLAARAGAWDAVTNADRTEQLQQLVASPAAERAIAALDSIEEQHLRSRTAVDLRVALTAMCAEIVSLAEGRIRSRRTLGNLSRTVQNYELGIH